MEMKALSTAPEIVDVNMEEGTLGDYDSHAHLIRLDPRQPGWQYRCTLEHEWVHSLRRDQPTGDHVLDARMELTAEREAAIRLIALDDLMDAVWWSDSLAELAEVLDVDPALLVARLDGLGEEDREAIVARLERAGRWIA